MKNQMVWCNGCDKRFEIDNYDYYEVPEEETFANVICPKCNTKLEVYWTKSIDFHTRIKDIQNEIQEVKE